jgi:hypothetical protein
LHDGGVMAEREKASKLAPAPLPRPQPPALAPAPAPASASDRSGASAAGAARSGPPGGNGVAAHAAHATRAAAPKVTAPRPADVIELQGQATFPATPELGEYIRQHGRDGADIRVKFGNVAKAGGTIRVASRDGTRFDTVHGTASASASAIPIDHELLAGPLAAIAPHLRIRIVDGAIGGWVAPAAKLEAPRALDKLLAEAGPALGLAGFDLSALNLQNTIDAGVLKLGTLRPVRVRLAGWLEMMLDLGLENDVVRLVARGDVNVRGLAQGALEVIRASGEVTGSAELAVQLPKLSGKVTARYAGGELSIRGTLAYATEKLRGSVEVVVMDAAEAEKAARAQIDPQQLVAGASGAGGDAEGGAAGGSHKPPPAKKGERGLAGWGELDFAFTDWLTGKAKAIFDPAGHVTVIGKIAPPKSIELLAERSFQTRLFGANLTARYGLPYVADVHVGLGVELGAAARLGPAVLSDLVVEGTYSTDPAVANAFAITGALRLSAYAGLNLRFEGKAGLTVLDHDVDIGAAVTGTAGVKGYAEARPTIGYREKADPAAGKQGEYYLKGRLELAAQPFLSLGGELFVRLDSPMWSPAPDKTWTWPLFALEYPVPGEFGIAAEIDHVIGSKQLPEIQWGKADFDASKFTDSLLDRQIPDKRVGGEVQKPGTWKGEAAPPPKAAAPAPTPAPAAVGAGKAPGTAAPKLGAPSAKAGKGGQQPDEARNVPKTPEASRRWLEGMKALGELHDRAEQDPETAGEIHAHLAAIKQRFGFTKLEPHLRGDYWVIDAELNPGKNDGPKQPTVKRAPPTPDELRALSEKLQTIADNAGRLGKKPGDAEPARPTPAARPARPPVSTAQLIADMAAIAARNRPDIDVPLLQPSQYAAFDTKIRQAIKRISTRLGLLSIQAGLNREAIHYYAQALGQPGYRPRVTVFKGVLVDGHHRLIAGEVADKLGQIDIGQLDEKPPFFNQRNKTPRPFGEINFEIFSERPGWQQT